MRFPNAHRAEVVVQKSASGKIYEIGDDKRASVRRTPRRIGGGSSRLPFPLGDCAYCFGLVLRSPPSGKFRDSTGYGHVDQAGLTFSWSDRISRAGKSRVMKHRRNPLSSLDPYTALLRLRFNVEGLSTRLLMAAVVADTHSLRPRGRHSPRQTRLMEPAGVC
jgi:hypothetical protein